jgi:hypothetical protein
MGTDMRELRAKAEAHQRRLDAESTFYTVQELAALLGCAPASVRAIPFARLPWTTIGRGARRQHRRYDPRDVEAYRAARGRQSAKGSAA